MSLLRMQSGAKLLFLYSLRQKFFDFNAFISYSPEKKPHSGLPSTDSYLELPSLKILVFINNNMRKCK